MDGACEYKLIKNFMVTEEKLATSVGSGSVEVLATPMVAAMMENTAAALAQQELDAAGETDCTTVGTALFHDPRRSFPCGSSCHGYGCSGKTGGQKVLLFFGGFR